MASTTYTDNQTVIYASWLNDVNSVAYNGTFVASVVTPSNLVCNGTVSGSGFTSLVNNTLGSPSAIGNVVPNTGKFTTLNASSLTLSSALPASSGGTGLTSPGTSGNILTSNGSGWVSSAGVTGTLGASGYTRLNNGLTFAWGSITTSNTGGSNNNFFVIGGSATLPVTFSSVYQATVSFGTGNVFYGASIGVSSVTTTTLTVAGSSPYGGGNPNVTYLVIGIS